MFQRYGKKGNTSQTKPLKDLTKIIPSEILLAEEKRDNLMKQIRNASALDEARFDSLSLSLVNNFGNHCQNLPDTYSSYYSQQGGLLDHALNRTEAALNLFQQYVILDEQGELSEDQSLWQYALFSAAILQGIGKLHIDYIVELYDNNGQLLKQWNPLLENLIEVGSYYNYEFQKESSEEFRRRLNLLIARYVMPASGFSWIASNSEVLAVWLALLNEDMEAAGTLGAILVRANAIAIQRYFNQFMLKAFGSRGSRYGRVGTFTGVPESVSEIEQQIGIEFIQWLEKSLDGGKIMINKAPLFMVPGGLMITSEVFDRFMMENPEYKNKQAVQNGFLSLGLHRLGADGTPNSRFEQNSNQQMHSGILFANYAVALPANLQLHNMHTGKSVTISATELIHQARLSSTYFTSKQATNSSVTAGHLNVAGQWQSEASSPSSQISLNPGVTNGV